jgi:Zn-dependent M28 family amino/carboxypeptidase
VILAALDGEESGLLGARAFLDKPPVDVNAIAVNVNLDMIGRDPADKLYASGTRLYPFLRPLLDKASAAAPLQLIFGHDDPNQREDWTRDSDHYAFHQAKIPFIYIGVEDFDQHHRATDDYETMTHGFYVRAVETAIQVVKTFDASLDVILRERGGGK